MIFELAPTVGVEKIYAVHIGLNRVNRRFNELRVMLFSDCAAYDFTTAQIKQNAQIMPLSGDFNIRQIADNDLKLGTFIELAVDYICDFVVVAIALFPLFLPK